MSFPPALFPAALLLFCSGAFSLFLRVETGHQNIAISGRDPYSGHFTRIHFHNSTCVVGIHIYCLKPLTGAEEIDLLYSECLRGHWKVAHYTNSKNYFRLKVPINVLRLSISSRKELSVIDVQVESCPVGVAPPSSSSCHKTSRGHGHRHERMGATLHAADEFADELSSKISHRRMKRALDSDMLEGVHDFHEDVEVRPGTTLTILPGAELRFGKDVGLIVKGKLSVNGTSDYPVIFLPIEKSWQGIVFDTAEEGSTIAHANVTGADIGVAVLGGVPPYMDHVILDGNGLGGSFKFEKATPTRLNKVTAVNSVAEGLAFDGKV